MSRPSLEPTVSTGTGCDAPSRRLRPRLSGLRCSCPGPAHPPNQRQEARRGCLPDPLPAHASGTARTVRHLDPRPLGIENRPAGCSISSSTRNASSAPPTLPRSELRYASGPSASSTTPLLPRPQRSITTATSPLARQPGRAIKPITRPTLHVNRLRPPSAEAIFL